MGKNNNIKYIDLRVATAVGCMFLGALLAIIFLGLWDAEVVSITDDGDTIGITYTDLVVILLAASALLITIVGVGVAVLAFVGYQQISTSVRRQAEETVETSLEDGGSLSQIVHQKLDTWLENEGKKKMYRGVERRDNWEETE